MDGTTNGQIETVLCFRVPVVIENLENHENFGKVYQNLDSFEIQGNCVKSWKCRVNFHEMRFFFLALSMKMHCHLLYQSFPHIALTFVTKFCKMSGAR